MNFSHFQDIGVFGEERGGGIGAGVRRLGQSKGQFYDERPAFLVQNCLVRGFPKIYPFLLRISAQRLCQQSASRNVH